MIKKGGEPKSPTKGHRENKSEDDETGFVDL